MEEFVSNIFNYTDTYTWTLREKLAQIPEMIGDLKKTQNVLNDIYTYMVF